MCSIERDVLSVWRQQTEGASSPREKQKPIVSLVGRRWRVSTDPAVASALCALWTPTDERVASLSRPDMTWWRCHTACSVGSAGQASKLGMFQLDKSYLHHGVLILRPDLRDLQHTMETLCELDSQAVRSHVVALLSVHVCTNASEAEKTSDDTADRAVDETVTLAGSGHCVMPAHTGGDGTDTHTLLLAPDVSLWTRLHKRWMAQERNMFGPCDHPPASVSAPDVWYHGAHVWSLQQRAHSMMARDEGKCDLLCDTWASGCDGIAHGADLAMDDEERQAHADAMCTVLQLLIGKDGVSLADARKAYYTMMEVWRRHARTPLVLLLVVEVLIYNALAE
jgi:hypothetical protein